MQSKLNSLILKIEKLTVKDEVIYDIRGRHFNRISNGNPIQSSQQTSNIDKFLLKFTNKTIILEAYFIINDGFTLDKIEKIDKVFEYSPYLRVSIQDSREIEISYSVVHKLDKLKVKT